MAKLLLVWYLCSHVAHSSANCGPTTYGQDWKSPDSQTQGHVQDLSHCCELCCNGGSQHKGFTYCYDNGNPYWKQYCWCKFGNGTRPAQPSIPNVTSGACDTSPPTPAPTPPPTPGVPTYGEIPNAKLPPPYLPIGGCMDMDSARMTCASYYDDNTQKSCAGFFFKHDESCPSDEDLYQFSNEFEPQPAERRANLQGSITQCAQGAITPCAVQLMFTISPNHKLDLTDKPQVAFGDFTVPAKTCGDATGCFAYQWQCPDAEKCESHDGIFPSEQLSFLLYTGEVGTGLDHLMSQTGQNVLVKREKKLPYASVPAEAPALVV